MFFEKKILVGISGGIAVYKTAELIREFKKAGALVRVIMTRKATKFVAPLTFETLTENSVLLDLFPENPVSYTVHIDWARWADVMLVCPATYNTIGKLASGIADNALTTTIAATQVPIIICPAMNTAMYQNPIYQENQQKLVRHGYTFVRPGSGELACGEVGEGRLADKAEIIDAVKRVLYGRYDLAGKRFLITAGPTEEPLDPVRYLTNRSSGKMGYALAEQARLRGAEVTLVSGPTVITPPGAVEFVRIRTAAEMEHEVMQRLNTCDVLIMAAAVSDYRPAQYSDHKLKKKALTNSIPLVANTDILARAGKDKGNRVHVGFSVETDNDLENSQHKLLEKNCDFIVINNPHVPGAAFQADTNKVTLLDKTGPGSVYPLMSKTQVAEIILDNVLKLIKQS
ncbi:MAG TPA: bifunctional phosphopantothenoylcysteine decarboxylase/phosphopantothenate--cysteine ligase CoaBC [bacterium]|nr:bifunctional phosphopantothenoylcysteine decarboxylase/phosphopantothenate--cysteine ligase CoaBC [bacterium]HPN43107.1 bifunctional phosphopantothenoylcysteine decarboxylase/phosphopantothenate--cysteine ligase CoaBC [bacterium]